MIRPPISLAIPLAVVALSTAAALAGPASIARAQVLVHERITIRVPRMSTAPIQRIVSPRRDWKERKGPKCLDIGIIAAAAIAVPTAIDLLLDDGRWMRARLARDCRSAAFYSGLYIRPGRDGAICADRDAIRVRSGATCPIESFKRLEPRD